MEAKPTWKVWRLVFFSNLAAVLILSWRHVLSSRVFWTIGNASLQALFSSSLVLLGIFAYSRDRKNSDRDDQTMSESING